MSTQDPAAWGKYRLLANLGQGGMADVCLAEARSAMGATKLVVVKRIRTELTDDPLIVAMFHDEARLSVRLNHPNVVQTYEVDERDDGVCFIVMEYLEGQPLSALCQKTQKMGKPFPERMMLHIVSDALNGLHYAHELRDYDGTPLKIVHRDISPHNLFVTYAGQTKVMDFGIAKAIPNTVKTAAGEIKGKLTYMAPEQANARTTDHRADIFSMGIVLWELLTGRRLMNGMTTAAVMHQLLMAPIPRPSQIVSTLEPALDEIIAKALARSPDDRYQTAREMRDAIEGYLAARGQLVRTDELEAFVAEVFGDLRESSESFVKARVAEARRTPVNAEDATLTQTTAPAPDDASSLPNPSLPSPRDSTAAQRGAPRELRPARSVVMGAVLAGVAAVALMRGETRRAPPPAPLATPRVVEVRPDTAVAPLASTSAPLASAVAIPEPPSAPPRDAGVVRPKKTPAPSPETSAAPPREAPRTRPIDTSFPGE